MKFYISAALGSEATARTLSQYLIGFGHVNTFPWWNYHEIPPKMLSMAQVKGVRAADVVIFLPPGARGTHMELGVALGAGIPIIGILPKTQKDALFYNLFAWTDAENLITVMKEVWLKYGK